MNCDCKNPYDCEHFAKNDESEEYIFALKEQIEDKNRLIQSMSQMIAEKDQIILMQKELLKGNSRMSDL